MKKLLLCGASAFATARLMSPPESYGPSSTLPLSGPTRSPETGHGAGIKQPTFAPFDTGATAGGDGHISKETGADGDLAVDDGHADISGAVNDSAGGTGGHGHVEV